MPPQGQTSPQQPTQPVQAPQQPVSPRPGQNTELLGKKIHNAGQSVFLLGCLLAFIGIIASLGLDSIEEDARVKTAAYLLMFVVVSIYWIVAGIQIKRNINNAQAALSTIRIVLITSIVVSVVSIIVSVIAGNLGAGDFAIILTLYLLVAQSRIKQLANQ